MDRAAPRDLYDVDNMVRFGLFSGEEEKENFNLEVTKKRVKDFLSETMLLDERDTGACKRNIIDCNNEYQRQTSVMVCIDFYICLCYNG